jgi:hypothetical protein
MGHWVIMGTPSAQQLSRCFTPCLQCNRNQIQKQNGTQIRVVGRNNPALFLQLEETRTGRQLILFFDLKRDW